MKYLKTYNKLLESSSLGKYYIKGHYWEYELGYIWSPKFDGYNGREITIYW